MSTPSNPVSSVADSSRSRNLYRVAIVGAASLKGKEVAEILNDRNFPAIDVKLLDDDESLGQLETMGDEITFIQSVRAEQFGNVDFTFFASDQESTRKNWPIANRAGSAIVDLSYMLEDDPGASVRAPWIERELGTQIQFELQPGPVVVAHPAAVVLALLVLRAQRAGALKRVIATVLEPASEHGQKGMDELHQQTVNLLSFQPLPKAVYDAQVAFNMISRYGENSVPALETVKRRVLKHYQKLLGNKAPAPSLMVVQAAIFHGHAFSVYLETEKPVAIGDVSQALTGEHVSMTRSAEDAPSNVNAAGQAEVLVSVERDATQENGYWIWAAADNLRIAALAAVESAESMVGTRPRGKIQ